jgi:predicted permease
MPSLLDVRYALRLLWRSPRFALLTIAVLGGGLGVSIYTYSVLHTMLYKDLPIPEGHSVVRILGRREGHSVPLNAFELAGIRTGLQSLSDVGAYTSIRVVLNDRDSARSIKTTQAEWNVFAFTRTQPLKGRAFLPEDGRQGAEAVAVLGYDVWQSVFAGDEGVIGSQVLVNSKSTRIIGVMPRGYAFPISAEMWLPLSSQDLNPTTYSDLALNAYARMRPGSNTAGVAAELNARLDGVHRQFPRDAAQREGPADLTIAVSSFQLAQTGSEGPFVFAVLNVVALFILLLACVNVGNLLLARTNARVKEIAVRLALGAPRGRLMMQMVLESVFICIIGGGPAVLLAGWALSATNGFLRLSFEGDLPYWWNWGLDSDTLLMAGLFLVVTILLVAVLPAYGATSVNVSSLLRDGTRGGTEGRTAGRISRALVVVQIVLISVVMQIGSVMAMVAYQASHVDLGMDTTRLVTMPIELSGDAYDTPAEQRQFYDRILGGLRQSPEIEGALLIQEAGEMPFAADGARFSRPGDYPKASLVLVSDSPTPLGTRLLEGRNFDARDSETGQRSAVVSEYLARTHWPGQSPLGRNIELVQEGVAPEARTVVGVVSNVKRGDVLSNRKENLLSVYVPLAQSPIPSVAVLAKYRHSEGAARTALYGAVNAVDANLGRGRIMNYDAVLKQLTAVATTLTNLFIWCGVFAILLAMTGIYGLTSNAVIRRTREIGVRRALGASDGNIIVLFLRQACRQLLVGLLMSAVLSAVVLYVMSQVAGLGTGLVAFSGMLVVGAISTLVLVAVYVPARRAVGVEPSVALRCD